MTRGSACSKDDGVHEARSVDELCRGAHTRPCSSVSCTRRRRRAGPAAAGGSPQRAHAPRSRMRLAWRAALAAVALLAAPRRAAAQGPAGPPPVVRLVSFDVRLRTAARARTPAARLGTPARRDTLLHTRARPAFGLARSARCGKRAAVAPPWRPCRCCAARRSSRRRSARTRLQPTSPLRCRRCVRAGAETAASDAPRRDAAAQLSDGSQSLLYPGGATENHCFFDSNGDGVIDYVNGQYGARGCSTCARRRSVRSPQPSCTLASRTRCAVRAHADVHSRARHTLARVARGAGRSGGDTREP